MILLGIRTLLTNPDLNDEEMEDLRRLAKEMVCPYIRNDKCRFSEGGCVYG